ncbi:hypothetical protein KKC45_03005 [Patescibacteria group bacterium]|nr:hypothetical protein [Patescibacteria group bacterium]
MTPNFFLEKAQEIVSEQIKKNQKLGIGFIKQIASTEPEQRKKESLVAYIQPEHVRLNNHFLILKICSSNNLVRIEFREPSFIIKTKIMYLYLDSGFHALEVIEAWSKRLPNCI